MADCYMDGCPNPGEFRVQIRWAGWLGAGSSGLLRPVAFCEEHARYMKRATSPDGAIWLDDPEELAPDSGEVEA